MLVLTKRLKLSVSISRSWPSGAQLKQGSQSWIPRGLLTRNVRAKSWLLSARRRTWTPEVARTWRACIIKSTECPRLLERTAEWKIASLCISCKATCKRFVMKWLTSAPWWLPNFILSSGFEISLFQWRITWEIMSLTESWFCNTLVSCVLLRQSNFIIFNGRIWSHYFWAF